ncbi:hypothetical protein V2J09_022231 [Rumex salicifolius]
MAKKGYESLSSIADYMCSADDIQANGSEKIGVWKPISGTRMENMQYAEELVREFLVFRGFTRTLQAFDSELSTDVGKGFQVDKILDLIFTIYIPQFQAEKLVGLLKFFKQCFSSSDTVLVTTLSKLEVSIFHCYIVHAVRSGKIGCVVKLFEMIGNDLIQKGNDWTPWFAIPYLKSPSTDPRFRIYFSKDWFDALHLSISSEKDTISRLRKDIKQLNFKLTQLQTVLEEKDTQLRHLRSDYTLKRETDSSRSNTSANTESGILERRSILDVVPSNDFSATSNRGESVTEIAATSLDMTSDNVGQGSIDPSIQDNGIENTNDASRFGFCSGEEGSGTEDEEFSEVKINFQETFLGHTGSISRSRFSASGNNIASASADGTVRIWTYDSSTPASRNATIYCGAEVLSLDWESKSDRLLLIGTADAGIKAWNVDAKRVVCDLSTDDSYRRILDIKCSPVEPIFVSAAASGRSRSKNSETGEFASLTVWNMKIWKAMTVLPLGEDPPAITSLCFNHNGKILAASAVFEWSLQNQGRVLWQTDCSRFHTPAISKNYRHELALDSDGRRLLVTSDSVRSPIYQVRGYGNSLKTLPHSAAVTTVDWHPTLPIFLTGSADNSIRVTSIL